MYIRVSNNGGATNTWETDEVKVYSKCFLNRNSLCDCEFDGTGLRPCPFDCFYMTNFKVWHPRCVLIQCIKSG